MLDFDPFGVRWAGPGSCFGLVGRAQRVTGLRKRHSGCVGIQPAVSPSPLMFQSLLLFPRVPVRWKGFGARERESERERGRQWQRERVRERVRVREGEQDRERFDLKVPALVWLARG